MLAAWEELFMLRDWSPLQVWMKGRGPLAGPVVVAAVICWKPVNSGPKTIVKKIPKSKTQRNLWGCAPNAIVIGIGIKDNQDWSG